MCVRGWGGGLGGRWGGGLGGEAGGGIGGGEWGGGMGGGPGNCSVLRGDIKIPHSRTKTCWETLVTCL